MTRFKICVCVIFCLLFGAVQTKATPCGEFGNFTRVLVLINGTGGGGMGGVIVKDKIISAYHLTGDPGSEVTIYFLPDFHKVQGHVVYVDPSVDLALITAKTGTIQPPTLSLSISEGTALHWWIKESDDGTLSVSCGSVLQKTNRVGFSLGFWNSTELQDKSFPGQESFLKVSGEIRSGTSGGIALTRQGKIAGVVVTHEALVSADRIKKFLLEASASRGPSS